MKWLVCGGRDLDEFSLVYGTLNRIRTERGPPTILIQGGASGADRLAASWAESQHFHVAEVKALWNSYGNRAGPIRNRTMLALGPDLVIAFPGGRGTENMVKQATTAGIEVINVQR